MQGITDFKVISRQPDFGRFGFEIKDENDRKFASLCDVVLQCGQYAKENQRNVHRTIKSDGTPVTEVDIAVSEVLNTFIRENWPSCSIISEEIKKNTIINNSEFTFIFDPVDGTDSYSQGMPGWCIGVGVLNSERKPQAAVLYAPRMGLDSEELFVCTTFNDKKVYVNGTELLPPVHENTPKRITVGSSILRQVNLSKYTGKIRSWGSALLHIVGPCIWSNIDLCLSPKCYAWDICASHVIASKSGFVCSLIDGKVFEYTDSMLFDREQTSLPFAVGSRSCVDRIIENLKE